LHPEAIARIARLELRAKAVVEGTLAGLHKSPYKGQSVEFLQHREYVRGDDPKRVDWKVWGRQDRLYVKEFEEETNLRLTLVVDCSPSMDYEPEAVRSRSRLGKHDCAATLAASLAWLALSHGDAVGCAVFDDRIRASVPARTKRSHLASVIEVLEWPRGRGAGTGHASAFLPAATASCRACGSCGCAATMSRCCTCWTTMSSTFRSTGRRGSRDSRPTPR
jgi:uncharacterized protein (DUF58 family)